MRRFVDLDERVTAQFYDQECEEWTIQTVTIEDVLDSVCDEYTVLPSVQPAADDDLVSREAVKKWLERWDGYIDMDIIRRMQYRVIDIPPTQSEPCKDTVSRQKLLSDLKELVAAWKKYPAMAEQIKGVETSIGYVRAIPPAQQERKGKNGKWIKLDMHAHLADHKCTACGQECYVPTCMGEPMYTYCPNCGARMEGESE